MNEVETAPEEKVRRLPDVIRDVKNDLADRDDVVVEMREAQRMRLQLLADELKPVIEDVPDDHQGLDFALSSGTPPRLWIDAVAHVGLGRDRRTYRFVRDTRLGRVVMAESTDMKVVVEAVTRYVAERIVERQRQLEGDTLVTAAAAPMARTEFPSPSAGSPESGMDETPPAAADIPRRTGGQEALSGFALVMMGGLAGVAVTLALLRDRIPELAGFFG